MRCRTGTWLLLTLLLCLRTFALPGNWKVDGSGELLSQPAEESCSVRLTLPGSAQIYREPERESFRPDRAGFEAAQLEMEVRLDADAPVKELQFTPADASLLTSGWHEFEIKAELAVSGSPAVARSYQDVFQVPVENAAMLLWNRMDPELNALLPLLRGRYQPFHFSYATLFGRLPEARQLKRIDSLQLLMLGPVQPDALPLNVRKRIARKLHEKTLTLLFLSPSVLNAWSRDPEIGVYVPASSASVLRLPPGTKYSFTAGSRNYDLPVTAFRRMTPTPSAVAKQTLKMRNLSLPLLLSSGNVSAFALAGTWRWRLSPDRSLALAYAPYWNMLLAACDNFDKSDLHFSITPADPLLADDLYRFTVEDYSKEPVRELYLLRQTEDGRTMKRLYRFGKAENHVYSTLLKITEPGIYEVYYQTNVSVPSAPSYPVTAETMIVFDGDTLPHTQDSAMVSSNVDTEPLSGFGVFYAASASSLFLKNSLGGTHFNDSILMINKLS